MTKIYIVDFLKEYVTKSNKNQLITYNRKNIIEVSDKNDFIGFLEEFKNKEIVDEDLVKSILSRYFPENFFGKMEKSSMPKETICELKQIIDSLFYTNLEENSLIDDLSVQKFISFMLNDVIKKIVVEYYFMNLQKDKLETDSDNNLELLEFEFMNKYDFLAHYFSSFIHLLTVFLAIEADIFTRNVELNDNLKNNFLEETRKFYNIIIDAFSKLKKDLTIFKVVVLQDKRLFPKKKEILKYDCYESLDYLISDIDNSIKQVEMIMTELKTHKEIIIDKIANNKTEIKERLKEISLFVAELIGKIMGNSK